MLKVTSNPNRRLFIATGLSAAAVASLPGAALALTDARAKALVDQVVKDINRVIASGKSQSAMISDFERIFSRYADVNVIARSTLGADSRRASNGQLRAYATAFRGYIARKYGKRFREFIGGRIEVHKVRKVKSLARGRLDRANCAARPPSMYGFWSLTGPARTCFST